MRKPSSNEERALQNSLRLVSAAQGDADEAARRAAKVASRRSAIVADTCEGTERKVEVASARAFLVTVIIDGRGYGFTLDGRCSSAPHLRLRDAARTYREAVQHLLQR